MNTFENYYDALCFYGLFYYSFPAVQNTYELCLNKVCS